jgi:hypothetical protein
MGVHPGGHTTQKGVRVHCAYSTMRMQAVIHTGLDGVFSVLAARPTERATRGHRRQAVGTGTRVALRGARRSADGSVDKTPHCSRGNVMALGRERTGVATRAWSRGGDFGREHRPVGPTW